MKKNVIFLFLLFFTSLAYTQNKTPVDYVSIKKMVTEKSFYFTELLSRYAENDTLLTAEDYTILYYGQIFRPEYKGSLDPKEFHLKDLMSAKNYTEAYDVAKEVMKENPVSLLALQTMINICPKLQKTEAERNSYVIKYVRLLHTIFLSGKGDSQESAFQVICVGDEYLFLYDYLKVFKIKNQKFIPGEKDNHKYDCFTIEPSKYFSGKEVYFDITYSYDKLTKDNGTHAQ